MNKKEQLKMLREISETNGTSGFERGVSKLYKSYVEEYVDEIDKDNLGSTIAIKYGKKGGPKVLFTAHMDEVGFMVSHIEENGYVRFDPVGGWWGHVVLAQRYKIITSKGKEVLGVTGSKPPHGMGAEERARVIGIDKMFLDLGVTSKKEVTELGVKVGDFIVPDSKFEVMNNPKFLLGKAWDDRICVAALIETIENLTGEELNCDLYATASAQEEVGLRGAKTATFRVKPDIGIALDVTMSHDLPGGDVRDTKLGSGVALCAMDRSVISHVGLRNYVEELCKKHKIPYTIDVLPAGGTDSGEIHKSFDGVINMTISIPCRYFHSHVSMINLDDYNNLVKLLTELIKSLDSKVLKELRK